MGNDLKEAHRREKQIREVKMELLNELELEKLKEIPMCIICIEQERQIIFKPCNHIACCSTCSKNLQECPICRKQITSKKTAYIA